MINFEPGISKTTQYIVPSDLLLLDSYYRPILTLLVQVV